MKLIYRKSHRNRRSSRTANQSSSLGWIWLLSGVFLGIIASVSAYTTLIENKALEKIKHLVYSKTEPLPKAEQRITPKIILTQKNTSTDQERTQKYEFYTLLPDMEVQLPDPEKAKVSSSKEPPISVSTSIPPTTTPQTASPVAPISPPPLTLNNPPPKPKEPIVQTKLAAAQYIIQAGLFALSKDALEFSNQLHSKGFKTRVQKIKTKDGIMAYRVLLGPFENEAGALNQKKRLEHHRIHGILILKQR